MSSNSLRFIFYERNKNDKTQDLSEALWPAACHLWPVAEALAGGWLTLAGDWGPQILLRLAVE
ncbi:hypothetical protein Tco_1119925, partial [Tanacetum coccineum]